MSMVSLSPRLQAIAKRVPPQAVIQDVGTDHGLVPLFLLSRKRIVKAFATDLREGPLEAISANPISRDFPKDLVIMQHNGILTEYPEIFCYILAGMGGGVIRQILEKGKNSFNSKTVLIIQPQNENFQVRQWLHENHFKIIEEEIVEDNKLIYEIIQAAWGQSNFNEKEIRFGRWNLDQRSPLFIKKLKQEHEHLLKIKEKIPVSHEQRTKEITMEIKTLEEIINENP